MDVTLPGRFDGVNGKPRPHDRLLSLQEDDIEARVAAARAALAVTRKSLGHPGSLPRRVMSPEPGDRVIEVTQFPPRTEDDWIKGFGILLDHRRERDGADWWYVQYGPAERDIARWGNSSFRAVPMW